MKIISVKLHPNIFRVRGAACGCAANSRAADGSAAAAPSQSVSQFRRGPPALTTPPPQRTAPLPSVNTSTPRGFWNFQASLLLFAGAGKNETNSPAVRCIASKRRRRQTLKCDTWGRRTRHDTHVDRAGPLARAPQEDLYGALVRSELTNRADTFSSFRVTTGTGLKPPAQVQHVL